jgi:hypothetical protein
MTGRRAWWLFASFLLVAGAAVTLLEFPYSARRRSTDPDFLLLERHPSPDNRFTLLVYRYDTGALGYSRVWWAVTPRNYEGVNLEPYELPDGYIAVGWAPTGELEVRPWTPYYYIQTKRTLKSGDEFRGVKVTLLPEEKRTGG